jgi:hypothetical protein
MTNPAVVIVAANSWTKVATAIKKGQLWIKTRPSTAYLVTHRDTGDPAPTDLTDAIEFDHTGNMPISSTVDIDVYVFNPDDVDGSIRVDL